MCRAGWMPSRCEMDRGGLLDAPSLVRKRGDVSENSRSMATVSIAPARLEAPASSSASRAAWAMRSNGERTTSIGVVASVTSPQPTRTGNRPSAGACAPLISPVPTCGRERRQCSAFNPELPVDLLRILSKQRGVPQFGIFKGGEAHRRRHFDITPFYRVLALAEQAGRVEMRVVENLADLVGVHGRNVRFFENSQPLVSGLLG